MKNLHTKSASGLAKLLQTSQISASEIVGQLWNRMQSENGKTNAFVHFFNEHASATASGISIGACESPVQSLAGIPVGLADNISTQGSMTTCASRMLQGYTPVYNATVVERLVISGATLPGKLNMDEFGVGVTGTTSYYNSANNPWDISYSAGGASGGGAAAVASCQIPLALGSDNKGDVRVPASLCGVIGFVPTYGSVSRYGVISSTPSFEQIGMFTRTVQDANLLYSIIRGVDVCDPITTENTMCEIHSKKLHGLRIALPKEYFGENINQAVKTAVLKAADELRALGAALEEVSLPSTKHALATYRTLASAEIASSLARYDGIKFGFAVPHNVDLDTLRRLSRTSGFGSEVKKQILLGTFVLAAENYATYYQRAKRMREQICSEFDAVFTNYDALLTPTVPVTAQFILETNDKQAALSETNYCTVGASLAGLPSITLPCMNEGRLPIGMQLIAPRNRDNTLLHIAKCYEDAVGGFPLPEGV